MAVYGVEGKERIIDAKETVNSYEYYADYAETGELFLVDADGLWCCDPNPRQLFYFADKDYFVQGALECGRINGITYGIPFDFLFFFAVFSKNLTQGRDAWTLSEMMEAAFRDTGKEQC